VDAVMHLMSSVTERGRSLSTIREIQSAATLGDPHSIISDGLPVVSSSLRTDDFERLRQELLRVRDLPASGKLVRENAFGALGVFLLVFRPRFHSQYRSSSSIGCSWRCACRT
jgi:hypothetical protein